MMGKKIRTFAPLPDLSLEELFPKDNFYRCLEKTLDLSFVGELLEERYATSGRPSIDPMVFFKLQLVLFGFVAAKWALDAGAPRPEVFRVEQCQPMLD
jgi:hypothetical protein